MRYACRPIQPSWPRNQIDLEQVRTAFPAAALIYPLARCTDYSKAYTVQSDSQLTNAAQFGQLIVTYKNGSPVHLNEIAHVYDSIADEKSRFWNQQ